MRSNLSPSFLEVNCEGVGCNCENELNEFEAEIAWIRKRTGAKELASLNKKGHLHEELASPNKKGHLRMEIALHV